MANELTLNVSSNLAPTGLTAFARTWAASMGFDLSTATFTHNVQSVGTSEEAILKGDVATPGYFIAVNLDATNFVSIRSGTGGTNMVKLMPGKVCVFMFASADPFWLADTAACRVEYLLVPAS